MPGERRIRRIVKYPTWAARPYPTTRVILYRGDKAAALNALYGRREGFGEATIKPRAAGGEGGGGGGGGARRQVAC
jgi:hypothetical protein